MIGGALGLVTELPDLLEIHLPLRGIAGLGGRDIKPEEFYEMITTTQLAIFNKMTPPPRLLYTAQELREIRKLQGIAHVEKEDKANVEAEEAKP